MKFQELGDTLGLGGIVLGDVSTKMCESINIERFKSNEWQQQKACVFAKRQIKNCFISALQAATKKINGNMEFKRRFVQNNNSSMSRTASVKKL